MNNATNSDVSSILITGVYGTGNCGDEAILDSIINLSQEWYGDVSICVASSKPEYTKSVHGVHSIPTLERDPKTWLLTIKESDRLFIGGGSILGGPFPARHGPATFLGKIFRTPVCFLATGHRSSNGIEQKLRNRYLNCADALTVRDEYSRRELVKDDVHGPIDLIPDPVFYKKNRSMDQDVADDIPDKSIIVTGRFVSWRNQNFPIAELASALDIVVDETDLSIVFIPLHYRSDDREFSKLVAAEMENDRIIIDEDLHFRQVESIIEQSKLVIGVRLHSLILATRHETPFVNLIYHQKNESALQLLDINGDMWYYEISEQDLVESILFRLDSAEFSDHLSKQSNALSTEAATLIKRVESMIGTRPTTKRDLTMIGLLSIIAAIKHAWNRYDR